MPWRETSDPYLILVSEIMLQQTQVERVRNRYPEFITTFPDVRSLADAPLADVLRCWQGLGYNRRAIALKRSAEEVVLRFNGQIPGVVADLESLPGIGHYTARAVAAFGFGIAEPLIETNIRTVFLHLFFHGRDAVTDREILPLVTVTLDRSNPREWYYALMDYGAMLKRHHLNPGRRSRHHVRQSAFEGSNRQLRSRLLQTVLKRPGVCTATLVDLIVNAECWEQAAIERNLLAMEREGFLECHAGGWQVPGSQ